MTKYDEIRERNLKNYRNIAPELIAHARFCTYQLRPSKNDPSRNDKIPYRPGFDVMAKTNDDSTFDSYGLAVEDFIKNPARHGIGVLMKKPFLVIDLDHIECIDDVKEGKLDNIVGEFLEACDYSYAEISSSGEGVHIFVEYDAQIPTKNKNSATGVEVYTSGRFIAMTGEVLKINGEPLSSVKKVAVDRLNEKLYKYIPSRKNTTVESSVESPSESQLTDEEVIELITKSVQGDLFSDLMYRDYTARYNSQSEADMAFCNILAFWTGRNAQQMDRIYRKSQLKRDKWDENRGDKTYGEMTIERAIADCQNVYHATSTDSVNDFNLGLEKGLKWNGKRYGYSDIGDRDRFLDYFGDYVRYNSNRKLFMFWAGIRGFDLNGKETCSMEELDKNPNVLTGARWKFDNEENRLIDQLIEMSNQMITHEVPEIPAGASDKEKERIEKAWRDQCSKSRSLSKIRTVREMIRTRLSVDMADYDTNSYEVNFRNGAMNLKTGMFVEDTISHNHTQMMSVYYDPKATCPKFEKRMRELFGDDDEVQDFIQRSFGSFIIGNISAVPKLFVVRGPRGTGKSTIFNVLRRTCGTYAQTVNESVFQQKSYQSTSGHTEEIADLQGSRFAQINELPENYYLDDNTMKKLLSTEPLKVSFKNEHMFSMVPQMNIVITSNNPFSTTATDGGTWRRIVNIPIQPTAKLSSKDVQVDFEEQLYAEAQGIANWLVTGAINVIKRPLPLDPIDYPDVIAEATLNLREDNDRFSTFFDDCLVVDGASSSRIKKSDMRRAYNEYCSMMEMSTLSTQRFNKKFKQYIEEDMDDYVDVIKCVTVKGNQCYSGVRFVGTLTDKNGFSKFNSDLIGSDDDMTYCSLSVAPSMSTEDIPL